MHHDVLLEPWGDKGETWVRYRVCCHDEFNVSSLEAIWELIHDGYWWWISSDAHEMYPVYSCVGKTGDDFDGVKTLRKHKGGGVRVINVRWNFVYSLPAVRNPYSEKGCVGTCFFWSFLACVVAHIYATKPQICDTATASLSLVNLNTKVEVMKRFAVGTLNEERCDRVEIINTDRVSFVCWPDFLALIALVRQRRDPR